MYPGNTPMDPGNMTPGNMTPGNMTPASGSGPLSQQVCGLGADGQLVKASISLPPPDPNSPTDTGQYCMSGGTLDGQCGTITYNLAAKTMQLCMHGQCTAPVDASSANTIPPTYNPTFLGVPSSSPVVPCPGTMTAAADPSTDPMGALGPPMDIAYPKRPGQPPYAMPPPVVQHTPPGMTTISINLPPNLPSGGTASGGQNICHPTPAANPGAISDHQPATPAAGNICNPKATAPKPNATPLTLKPKPGGTQVANAGAQPCNPNNTNLVSASLRIQAALPSMGGPRLGNDHCVGWPALRHRLA